MNSAGQEDQANVLDLSKYPTAQEFVDICARFFEEVEDL